MHSRTAQWDGSTGGCSGGAQVEQLPLAHVDREHGFTVAVQGSLLAIVASRQPDRVLVVPTSCGLGETARRADRRVLQAPESPLSTVKFSDFTSPRCACQLLLASTRRSVFIWDLERADAQPFTCIQGVEAVPPSNLVCVFDETAALVAVGGADSNGSPALIVFCVNDGRVFTHVNVPSNPEVKQSEACVSAVTSCCFLGGDSAYILLVAVHVADRRGSVFAYDLRSSCDETTTHRASERFSLAAAHETELLDGAPFHAMSLHRVQQSVVVLGGESVFRMLQVRESSSKGSGLRISQLAEVSLSRNEVPVWLRDAKAAGRSEAEAAAQAGDPEDGEAVLAMAAMGCRVVDAPGALDVRGTAALVITTGGLFAVWGHRRSAERLCSLSPVSAAAACVDAGGITAVCLRAFSEGGDLVRFSLAPELHMDQDAAEETTEVQQQASFADLLLGGLPIAGADDDMLADPPMCSVVPFGPIPDDSMLGRALAPPSAPSTPSNQGGMRRAGSAPHRGSSGVVTNQPVTFNRKVKSAGYGPPTEPPRQLGRPKLVARNSSGARSRPDFGPPGKGRPARPRSSGPGVAALGRYASSVTGPPLEPCPDQAMSAYSGCAAVELCYTPMASHLLLAGSDRTLLAYRLPLRGRAGEAARALAMGGHQGDIVSICPSYTESHSTGGGGGPLMLSASADRTVRMWSLGGSHAGHELICFDRLRTNLKSSLQSDNAPFEQVQDVQFLCLDGAVVIATGSRLGVYKYQLHTQDGSDDIKRLQRMGSYKCCGLLSLPKEPSGGHSISVIAANNSVMSGTLLVASSAKRIHAWDVAAEKVLASVRETSMHSRPLTCLRLAQPHSEFSGVQSMDLFYTASMDGTIKLWDLRQMQEIQCFSGGHVHSGQRLKCSLSPCLRYLCSPSEDGNVCVYDVRAGGVLGGRHCHRDVVSAVDVHPNLGVMASCGFDGAVHFHRCAKPAAPARGQGRPPPNQVERSASCGARAPRMRQVEMEPAASI